MPRPTALEEHSYVSEELLDEIAHLTERVTEGDGVRPLSEAITLALLDRDRAGFEHLCARLDDKLVGYAGLDLAHSSGEPTLEIAVDPTARHQGIGGQLLDLAIHKTSGRLDMWAHGEFAAAGALAQSRGFERTRTLYRMRRSLLAPLPQAELPADISIDSFRPADIFELAELNRVAFADLPDQGNLSVADLRARTSTTWFDPAGLLLARRESDRALVGFHWTKVHTSDSAGHEPVGEIYVLAVHPDFLGQGLGRTLSVAGMQHLRSVGLPEVMLYVDASNTAAVNLYERLGFQRYDTDILYRSPIPARPAEHEDQL